MARVLKLKNKNTGNTLVLTEKEKYMRRINPKRLALQKKQYG